MPGGEEKGPGDACPPTPTSKRDSRRPRASSRSWEIPFDLPAKEARIAAIDREMGRPGFWDDQERAQKLVVERGRLAAAVGPLGELNRLKDDTGELLEAYASSPGGEVDEAALEELSREAAELETRLGEIELRATLSGPDDQKNAFLRIHAGAGGTDSCDWAGMLLRMYTRYLERRGLKATVVDLLPNEEAGIRSATVRVEGELAYGWLRSEIGVHRLVRISPFDAAHRRHTSFSSVDVLPEVEDVEVEINEKDLRIDVFRASGKGGQHVNVTDSAVRITHLPTGVVASCQNERSQHQNRAMAMKVLKARLQRLADLEREREMARLYSEKGEIAWGNQIRSYTLQPFQLVKDHRTGVETGNVQAVLDGEIEGFVEAYLRRFAGRR
jgi:peptide chain release factor 2